LNILKTFVFASAQLSIHPQKSRFGQRLKKSRKKKSKNSIQTKNIKWLLKHLGVTKTPQAHQDDMLIQCQVLQERTFGCCDVCDQDVV